MKREQIYLSTAFDISEGETPDTLRYRPNALKAAAEYGFGLELAEYCVSANMDDDALVKPRFHKNAAGAARKLLHAPFFELYPHAVDSRVRAVALERYRAALRIAEDAGCTKMIVHANFVESLYFPAWFVEKQTAFWKAFLADYPGNMTICLENVTEPDPALIGDIISGVADPRFRACLDTGHANLTPVMPERWIETLGGLISHFHLHNNNGPTGSRLPCSGDTHSALDDGSADMAALLRLAEKTVPDATYTLETACIRRSAAWLERTGFLEKLPVPEESKWN